MRSEIAVGLRNGMRERIGLLEETTMPQSNHIPKPTETGEQVPTRPHDLGVRPMKPSMVWIRHPSRYGSPQRALLQGLASAMSKRRRS